MNIQQILFLLGIICWVLLVVIVLSFIAVGISNTSVIFDALVGALVFFGFVFIIAGGVLSKLRHGFNKL